VPALVAGALAGQTPAPAADLLAVRESAAWKLIASLQSPYCPGLTLESCPSWYADSLRGVIRKRMATGEAPERIRQELAAKFGQRVLGEPTWQGFDVLGWMGPAVLIGGTMAGLALLLRRRQRTASETDGVPTPAIAPIGTEERARLEALLARELVEVEDR
jgi:cytochrome c-type biogenesis protein CcmH